MNSETVFEQNSSSRTSPSIAPSTSGARQQRELEHEGEMRRFAGELYEKLKGMELNQSDLPLNFTKRLARENLWEVEFASRVHDEYLRFVILAGVAGHPVTPSEAVDEAWHLHLTYTRSYWDDMCGGILGSPLHHDPTGGTVDDQKKYVNWYEDTLSSYRKIFAEVPPADI
jgi:hypothetical protein